MTLPLLQILNRDVPTPTPWVHRHLTFTATWGESPLNTTLTIELAPQGSLNVRVIIGAFRGLADAEFTDEIPGALRRAYAQAISDAQGTSSASDVLRDVGQAPVWIQEGLLHALDQEALHARVEVKRLTYLLGHAQNAYDGAAFRLSLLREVLRDKTPTGQPVWISLITDAKTLGKAFDYEVGCGRSCSAALTALEAALLQDGHEGDGKDDRRVIFNCYPGDGRASITDLGEADGKQAWRVVFQRSTTGPVYAEVYGCASVQEVQDVIASRTRLSRALLPEEPRP